MSLPNYFYGFVDDCVVVKGIGGGVLLYMSGRQCAVSATRSGPVLSDPQNHLPLERRGVGEGDLNYSVGQPQRLSSMSAEQAFVSAG